MMPLTLFHPLGFKWVYYVLFVTGLCFGLLACSSRSDLPQTHFEDYQARLARVLLLDVDQVHTASSMTPENLGITPPRKRDRMLPIPKSKLSFFDFLRLDNCEIKALVAQRNNQLGQHMQAVNGIIHEIEIRQALSACIPRENNIELQRLLRDAQIEKQASFGLDLWQHSFGSDWYGAFASTSVAPVLWSDEETLLANVQAWQSINYTVTAALKSGSEIQLTPDKAMLNQAIKTLESSQGLGKLQVSLVSVMNELEKTNQILANASIHSVCLQQADGSRVAKKNMGYFNNVVANYFAKDIQVYLARLYKHGQLLVTEQGKLLHMLEQRIQRYDIESDIESDSKSDMEYQRMLNKLTKFKKYQAQLENTLTMFQQSTRAHVLAIQRVQKLCE